jgi:hypothetical protein
MGAKSGGDDGRGWPAGRRTRLIDLYDMKIAAGGASGSASSCRLGVATPISTARAYQLKGGYHVSFRHSFNRRHYRRGT